MKKMLVMLVAGLMVMLIIIGCGTDDPWAPEPERPLDMFLVSAPDTSTEIPAYSTLNFVWAANGGADEITYQWYLEPLEAGYNTASVFTSAVYDSVGRDTATAWTFHVRATSGTEVDSAIAEFRVLAYTAPPADTDTPTVSITTSPTEGSYVAVGSSVTFAWEGEDGEGNDDMLMYQYAFPTMNDSSAWLTVTTIVKTGVTAANPAGFYVRTKDMAGNMSDWDSVTFIIRPATILYIDDYQFLDTWGDVDVAKERDQKQFYRNALDGYAFAEWDIAVQGMIDSATIITYSTVIFGSDASPGAADGSGTWWNDIGAANGGPVRYFMESGGNLLVCGPVTLLWIYNNNPPIPGDFEFDWFGIDSTSGWDYWDDFTWAVNAGNIAGLPDSLKIDVAKNGDQIDRAEDIFAFRDSVVVLFTKGLDIDGEEPHDYGESVGHIYYPGGGAARSAMLNFDVYSMPPEGIKQTFQTILTQFGE